MKYTLKEILNACIYACDEEAYLGENGEIFDSPEENDAYAEKLRLAIEYLEELKKEAKDEV